MPKGNLAAGQRVSDLLRVTAGTVDLAAIDARATPGFDGGKADAEKAAPALGERLATRQEQLYAEGSTGGSRSVLLVLQGMDTSGKGGTVKHVVGQLDPGGVHVASFGKPTPEELAHDFLWRIRAQQPRPGKLGVFDRSHYEDVVTVRVLGLVDEDTWTRRYDVVNQFEEELVAGGTRIVKCFLHISREEQQRAAPRPPGRPHQALEVQPGRPRQPRALGRLHDAPTATRSSAASTEIAPWHVVPADRKWYRNWAITNLLLEELDAMGLRWPEASFDVAAERRAAARDAVALS